MLWYAEAKVKDLEAMTWYTYIGPKKRLGTEKEFHQKHTLNLVPDELVALAMPTRGPSVGKYRVVLGSRLHVLFRSVPAKMIDNLLEKGLLVRYKGKIPEHDVLPEGRKRVAKVRIRERAESDKLTDDLYKPTGPVRETTQYNRDNYQWRKVVHEGTKIQTMKQGRTKYTLQKDDVIGVRYMTKARGGFIILPDMQRVNIHHDTYQLLLGTTRILPSSKQQKGLVILSEIKANLPKQTRVRKPKEPEPDVRDSNKPKPESAAERLRRRLGHDVAKTRGKSLHEELPDEADDWDDDEESVSEPTNPEPLAPPVPTAHSPIKVLKVGSLIQSSKRPDNRFVVVDSTAREGYTEFALYGLKNKDVRILRIPNEQDMAKYKSATVVGDADKSQLAAGKRALNGAVKNKTFTVGSIHD
ncbi:hypothetical protein D3C85_811560 [compost metagenome]